MQWFLNFLKLKSMCLKHFTMNSLNDHWSFIKNHVFLSSSMKYQLRIQFDRCERAPYIAQDKGYHFLLHRGCISSSYAYSERSPLITPILGTLYWRKKKPPPPSLKKLQLDLTLSKELHGAEISSLKARISKLEAIVSELVGEIERLRTWISIFQRIYLYYLRWFLNELVLRLRFIALAFKWAAARNS